MFARMLLSLLLLFCLISCSGSKSTETVENTEGIELVEGDDDLLEIDERTLLEDSGDSGVTLSTDSDGLESIALDDIDNQEVGVIETQPIDGTVDSGNSTSTYQPGEEFNTNVQIAPEAMSGSDSGYTSYNSSYSSGNSGGATSSYRVEKNDTLMLIAFKLYGDYSRWRELANLNASKLGSGGHVMAGTNIRYYTNGSGFSWNPSGEPYLIKQRDTLGKISNKVYGTFNHWRAIWNNNRSLIKNPDLIFAGFTIYYPTNPN